MYTPPITEEYFETWITSDTDLASMDWILSGSLVGMFSCDGGGTSCLRDESIKLNVKLADVTVVPVPAAAWLFGSALMLLAGLRRRG